MFYSSISAMMKMMAGYVIFYAAVFDTNTGTYFLIYPPIRHKIIA